MEPPLPQDAEGSAPPTSASASQSPPTKRRRTAPATIECCRTCRLRKVKCTGNPGNGPCSNCSRLELACSFVVAASGSSDAERVSRTTPSHSHTEAGTLRKRAQRACSQCHTHKTKCSGDLPKCKRCESAGLLCEYTPARRRFTNVRFNSPGKTDDRSLSTNQPFRPEETNATSPTSSTDTVHTGFAVDPSMLHAEEILLRKDIILRHLDAYFNFLYMVPSLGFLHPAQTYREIQDGTFPPAQAAAICAVTSFFVNPGRAGRDFGKRCSEHVEIQVLRNMYKFSEDALFLFALNILFNILQGSHAKVWQCFGVAARLMIGLQLNWEVAPRSPDFIQQESLRRVAWQLFCIDRLLAGGYEEYISCRAENMKIRLPCNEAAFRENQPVVAERLHEKPGRCSPALGLHGIQIRLVDLRHRIQVTTKKLAGPSGANAALLESSRVMADINALQNELTRFHASIPDDLRLSDISISRYAVSEQWRGYVFFHTHMAASHIDLYRFSLPGPRDQACIDVLRKLPREFIARSQRQAVGHAMCLARFLHAIKSETDKIPDPGSPKLVGDYSVAHMATQCLRVLFVALQYKLYDNLDDTTAPLWRSGPTSESQIRSFIACIMDITEPWSHIFDMAKQAHDCNKAMLEEFDKSRKLGNRQNVPGMTGHGANDEKRLPRPIHMLEKSAISCIEEEQTTRPADMPVSDWWLYPTATQQSSPSTASPMTMTYGLNDVNFDSDFGPPGVSMFLAQARSVASGVHPLYDPDSMPMPVGGDVSEIAPADYSMLHPASLTNGNGLGMLHIDGNVNGTGFQPDMTTEHNQSFVPTPPALIISGYPAHYSNAHGDPPAYMQQNGYA